MTSQENVLPEDVLGSDPVELGYQREGALDAKGRLKSWYQKQKYLILDDSTIPMPAKCALGTKCIANAGSISIHNQKCAGGCRMHRDCLREAYVDESGAVRQSFTEYACPACGKEKVFQRK